MDACRNHEVVRFSLHSYHRRKRQGVQPTALLLTGWRCSDGSKGQQRIDTTTVLHKHRFHEHISEIWMDSRHQLRRDNVHAVCTTWRGSKTLFTWPQMCRTPPTRYRYSQSHRLDGCKLLVERNPVGAIQKVKAQLLTNFCQTTAFSPWDRLQPRSVDSSSSSQQPNPVWRRNFAGVIQAVLELCNRCG